MAEVDANYRAMLNRYTHFLPSSFTHIHIPMPELVYVLSANSLMSSTRNQSYLTSASIRTCFCDLVHMYACMFYLSLVIVFHLIFPLSQSGDHKVGGPSCVK